MLCYSGNVIVEKMKILTVCHNSTTGVFEVLSLDYFSSGFCVLRSQGVYSFVAFIQSEHDELEAKFNEERAALEAKYAKLYEPLYVKVHSSILRNDWILFGACLLGYSMFEFAG